MLSTVKNMFTKPAVYTKYTFPRVIISGTQVCCGFRPCYLDNAKHPYQDQGGIASPYPSLSATIFGMCYFSKFHKHHQYAKRAISAGLKEGFRFIDITRVEGKDIEESMYAGGTAVNYRHWILDINRALLLTHTVNQSGIIKKYIQDNNLGDIISMPNWVSKVTLANLSTFLWFWNGNVPTPESAGIKDFPFDVQGNPIPGRTNLRDAHDAPYFESPPSPTSIPTNEIQATAA